MPVTLGGALHDQSLIFFLGDWASLAVFGLAGVTPFSVKSMDWRILAIHLSTEHLERITGVSSKRTRGQRGVTMETCQCLRSHSLELSYPRWQSHQLWDHSVLFRSSNIYYLVSWLQHDSSRKGQARNISITAEVCTDGPWELALKGTLPSSCQLDLCSPRVL